MTIYAPPAPGVDGWHGRRHLDPDLDRLRRHHRQRDTHHDALAEVQAAVPDGFVLLSVQVEHPDHA
jgi:hypothetical protein